MGLDMYLTGNKYFMTDWQNDANNRKEDGFKIEEVNLRLGYWRRHPDLHGFIVATFAKGVDECQEIPLEEDDIKEILKAVKENKLPKTSGFFFGESDSSREQETLSQFSKALEWVLTKEELVSRSVVYRASW